VWLKLGRVLNEARILVSFWADVVCGAFFKVLIFSCLMLCVACAGVRPNLQRPLSKSEQSQAKQELQAINIELLGGSKLEIYYQGTDLKPLALNVADLIRECHGNFMTIFGTLPIFSTSIVLVDSEYFYLKTASPRWIHAIFHNGRIIIPLLKNQPIDYVQLYRSLKHEYTHAVVSALSGNSCPGWIDEGLAQWFEGIDRQSDHYILVEWLKIHDSIPLKRLQKGFLNLDQAKAKVGYAQSFFAVNDMISSFNMSSFVNYFALLKKGIAQHEAFYESFGLSQKNYELKLKLKMQRWVHDRKYRV